MEIRSFQARSVSELLDASVRLIKQHYKPLLVLSALGYIPMLIVSLFMPQPAPGEVITDQQILQFYARLPLMLPAFVWLLVTWTAMIVVASEFYLGRDATPGAALRRVLARFGPLLGGTALKWLAILGWAFLFVIAISILGALLSLVVGTSAAVIIGVVAGVGTVVFMFVIYARYFFVGTAVVLENAGGVASVKRSVNLTAGHRWHVIKATLLFYILMMVVWLTAWSLVVLTTRNFVVSGVIGQATIILVFPLIPAVTALLYYDLRIRKEGFDLELMAQSLEGGTLPQATVTEGVRGT